MPRQRRVGLRPPTEPQIGTYWKAIKSYDNARPNAPMFVAVTKTERKYARMGMQECFVTFVPAAEYATKMTTTVPLHIAQDTFMHCFRKVGDEELGHDLGMEILAHYG